MAILNTATSIVDFLKSKGQPSDFGSRQRLFGESGLTDAFGDFRGTAEQNTALLNKLRQTSAPATNTLNTSGLFKASTGSVGPGGQPIFDVFRDGRPVSETDFSGLGVNIADVPIGEAPAGFTSKFLPAISTKDIIDRTSPTAPFDPIKAAEDIFEEEFKEAKGEISEAKGEFAGEAARSEEELRRNLARAKGISENLITDEEIKSAKKQSEVAEKAAGFGGAFSGVTAKSQRDIQGEAQRTIQQIEQKLGFDIAGKLTDFEKRFGTDFLRNLSIKEAEEFTKLPVDVRGSVVKAFQDTVNKSLTKARKDAQSALNSLGYIVLPDGTIVQKPSERRAEESAVRAEEAAARAEKPAIQKEFEFAQSQGFTGTLLDYQRLKATQFGTERETAGTAEERLAREPAFTPGFSNRAVEKSFREDFTDIKVKQNIIDPTQQYDALRTLYAPQEVSDQAIKDMLGIKEELPNPEGIADNWISEITFPARGKEEEFKFQKPTGFGAFAGRLFGESEAQLRFGQLDSRFLRGDKLSDTEMEEYRKLGRSLGKFSKK